MKIKQTVLVIALSLGLASLFVGHTTFAASCGGVETSVINCAQTGVCGGTDGENPYEGTDPKGDTTKINEYKAKYLHAYGFCINGNAPIKSVQDNGIWGILLFVINILTAGVGVAAVGGIVYSSILYTTAGGSPEQAKKARTVIVNTVVGMIAYALMFSFLNFIIPGGLFSPSTTGSGTGSGGGDNSYCTGTRCAK